ncbi:MAG: hypothetical protein IT375_29025 [Polyangiaceae bacterium]|nr:hypothetical protein [Polyangiaceae bacterium]
MKARLLVMVALATSAATAQPQAPVPVVPASSPRLAIFPVHVAPGIDPSLGALVERQLAISARALGYARTDAQLVARLVSGASGALSPERAAALVQTSGSAVGLFAAVSSEPGRYRISVQAISPDRPPKTAEASGVSSDLYASIDQAVRAIVPAPAPPTPAPAAAPAPAEETFPEGRFRLAFGGAAAFGVSPGPFQNYLGGMRADRRFSDEAAFGLGVYYANLKGKDGRAHNVLPWALFEYRVDLGSSWALPLRFASGYLPKNGPVVKLAAGVSLPLGENLELSTELFAPTIWITNERAVLSLDVSAEIGVTF